MPGARGFCYAFGMFESHAALPSLNAHRRAAKAIALPPSRADGGRASESLAEAASLRADAFGAIREAHGR